MNIKPLMSALLLIIGTHTACAAETGFADGKPWKMKASDGLSADITFNGDGTGRIKSGLMAMKLKWAEKGDEVCLTIGPMAERCMVFVQVDGGYDGSDGKTSMMLRRQ